MSVPSRRVFVLVSSWRNLAINYERGTLGAEMSEAERLSAADTWRGAATMLCEDARLCVVCVGRGVEFSPASEEFPEEYPAGWFSCGHCKGSGVGHLAECANCSKTGWPDEMREREGRVLCLGCWLMAEKHPELGFAPRWEPPFGRNA